MRGLYFTAHRCSFLYALVRIKLLRYAGIFNLTSRALKYLRTTLVSKITIVTSFISK